MFAVIESGGKQVKIQEGDTIQVEKLEGEDNSIIILDKVLLIADGENVSVGQPYLEGVSISTTKVKDDKAKKVIIFKFRRRKSWDKKIGHRQPYSVLKIDKINLK